MAILDRRLFPFLEMLAELDLDWLAFELVDGIRRGIEPEVSEGALKAARARARAGEPARYESGTTELAAPADAKPLVGDDQLSWVAIHVERRLDETFADAIVAIQNLDAVIDNSPSDTQTLRSRREATKLVLLDGGEEVALDLRQAQEAQRQLEKLKGALADWLKSTREDATK